MQSYFTNAKLHGIGRQALSCNNQGDARYFSSSVNSEYRLEGLSANSEVWAGGDRYLTPDSLTSGMERFWKIAIDAIRTAEHQLDPGLALTAGCFMHMPCLLTAIPFRNVNPPKVLG